MGDGDYYWVLYRDYYRDPFPHSLLSKTSSWLSKVFIPAADIHHIHVCLYVYVGVYVCMYVCMYVFKNVCMYECIHSMCAYICFFYRKRQIYTHVVRQAHAISL